MQKPSVKKSPLDSNTEMAPRNTLESIVEIRSVVKTLSIRKLTSAMDDFCRRIESIPWGHFGIRIEGFF